MSSQWKMTGGNLTDFIWQYISQTATLYNWILKIETETKFATLLLKKKGKTEHSLSIKNWTSLRINTQIFLWVPNGEGQVKLNQLSLTAHFSISWTATLFLPLEKPNTFYSKMLTRRLQKFFKNATPILNNFSWTWTFLQTFQQQNE